MKLEMYALYIDRSEKNQKSTFSFFASFFLFLFLLQNKNKKNLMNGHSNDRHVIYTRGN